MVIMDLDGNKIEGKYNPSSDTATHIELYKAFPNIGGIVHTHSPWATSWAQSGRGIPCYGTTHADYMYGEIPCVRNLTKEEIDEAYEKIQAYLSLTSSKTKITLQCLPYYVKITVLSLGAKTVWRLFTMQSYLKKLRKWRLRTEMINPKVQEAPQELKDKHYYRKHGANAYYGQNN